MKFRALTLENFRQFRGRHVIEFSREDGRNVTLIWGANGAGKTTLLNAFTWVLYGVFTPDFEQPDKLANDYDWRQLEDGDTVSVRVELEFEHEDSIYHLARHSRLCKQGDGTAVFDEKDIATLSVTDETGRNYEKKNPDEAIKQILPDRLHNFFFFNGERIEHLVDSSAYEQIGEAIKTILGLEIVDRGLRHLPKASKEFEKQLKDVGTGEQKEITQAIERIEDDNTRLEKELQQAKRNAASLKDERDAIDKKLLQTAEVRGLQEQRKDFQKQSDENDVASGEAMNDLESLIKEKGFLAFAYDALERTRNDFAERRKKGEIPTPIKKEFINDLLEKKECICGADLTPGTRGYDHICGWRERAGLLELDDAWHALFAEAGRFLDDRRALGRDLAGVLARRERARTRRRELSERLSELSQKIGDSGFEGAEELERARGKKEEKLEEEQRRIGSIERELKENGGRLTARRSDLRKAQGESAQAEVARRRVTLAQDAIEALQKIFELRIDEVRRSLDERIRQVYGEITYKSYVPRLTDEFALKLSYDEAGENPVPKSTGENQILSLSFVGALAALARERYERSRKSPSVGLLAGAMGGVFPIVMDAAFGTLDENYRRDIARGLPKLAPQVVVLVSKSQGQGPVAEELEGRVDRSYVIHFQTSKDDVTSETLDLHGRSHPYIEHSGDGIDQAVVHRLE